MIDARESGTSTGRYIDKLVEYLHKQKPDFDFTVLTMPGRVSYLKSVAPDFKIVQSTYKEFSMAEQTGFLKQLKALNADLVHFGMTQQPIFYQGKVVTTIHDLTTARFTNPAKNRLVFKIKQMVYRWVIKKVARKSYALITPSNFVKSDVAQYAKIDLDKIAVIYEAADKINKLAEPLPNLVGKKFLLHVGRPLPHKNLNRLIDAFIKLKATHPDLQLVLAGKFDDNYQLLKNYAVKKSAKDVIFTDFVSEGQLRWLYEQATAYVFPSLSEGFGLPGLEAMIHGTPVVSSDATCLPEVYKDGALYFNPLDADDMATKISEVLDSPQLCHSLVTAGKIQAAKYSWDKTASRTLNVYKSVLS